MAVVEDLRGGARGVHERTIRRCRFWRFRGTSSSGRFVSSSTPLRLSSLMIFLAREWHSERKLRMPTLELARATSSPSISQVKL